MKSPFRYLLPTFFSGLFDDPRLYIKVRPSGRGLLFDCGKLHQLAKRVIKSLDAVFVSHAHMDHFMGISALTRSMHVASRTLELFGPPEIADRMEHHLGCFDWNLAEPWWGSWRVHAVERGRMRQSLFAGAEGFVRRAGPEEELAGAIYENPWLEVHAELFDHRIPVLGFRIVEKPCFSIDPKRLEEAGYTPGPWLEDLRRHLGAGRTFQELAVQRHDGAMEVLQNLVPLYRRICRLQPPAAIGYLTDVALNDQNLGRIRSFFSGVSLLVCECSFLAAEKKQARRSFHLCSEDFNLLLDQLRPALAMPMHLSKTYLKRSGDLYGELDPPAETRLLRLPDYRSPRPLLADELPLLT